MMKPAKPNMPIAAFFTIIATLDAPVFPFKNTHVSRRAGNARPSDDRHNAPNNDMNRSSCGTATAKRTANENDLFYNCSNGNDNNPYKWLERSMFAQHIPTTICNDRLLYGLLRICSRQDQSPHSKQSHEL